MPRLTEDQWRKARIEWEADATATFESVAAKIGVSRVAVSKKAAKDGWEKVQRLSSINEAAQLRADAKVTGRETSEAAKVSRETRKRATVEQAIDVRADVIDRHRADWAEHRKLFGLPKIEADFENGKKAKISAEMLLLRQKGERAAYGLDDLSDKPVKVAAPAEIPVGAELDAYRDWMAASAGA